jgi:hypothetical protein
MSKTIDEDLREHRDWHGLRNSVTAAGFDLGDLEVGLNVDIDDKGFLLRRKGHSAVVVAGVDRDLFAAGGVCLGVGSNALKQIFPNWSTQVIHSGLALNRPLTYAAVANRIYYSNGVESGAVENGQHRSWGLVPPTPPAATMVGGSLRAGRYQYTMTYLRSDGQESGAPRAAVVELTAMASGYELTLPVSTDPTVTLKAVYVSARDGETLHRYTVVDNATITLAVAEERAGTVTLATQFLVSPNMLGAIDHIAYGNGRMLAAAGSRLYCSEPYAPELFDPRKSWPFLDAITMVTPLEDGTWLGTRSQVIWLPNAEPEKWQFMAKAPYGVIPGTAYVDGLSSVGDGSGKGPAVYFATTQGLCVGGNGGQMSNFTEGRFAYPIQERGAGIVRRHRGMIQYLTTLHGAEVAGNVAA